MKWLILFDIDNTLIKYTLIQNKVGHSHAFSYWFKKVYNIDTDIDIINYSGMTNQQIIIEVLKKNWLKENEILPKINNCMEEIIKYTKNVKDSIKIEVFDWVKELLNKLEEEGFLMGLVTWNLEKIAQIKMKISKLDKYFKVGGFWSDNINRTELVKLTIKQAKEKFNFENKNNIFLIWDTPKDIIAWYQAWVKTIWVATWDYSRAELGNSNADYVLSSLQETKKIFDIIRQRYYN